MLIETLQAADPGFPRGGAPAYYYLTKLSRKLHENEENMDEGGTHVQYSTM